MTAVAAKVVVEVPIAAVNELFSVLTA